MTSYYKVTDTELSSIADAIRQKGSTSAPLVFPSGFVSAVIDIPTGGGTNLGSLSVSENGTYTPQSPLDGFNSVVVDCPVPTGSISISQNGTFDVSAYANAVVSVEGGITPTGSLSISQNGTYDVTSFASAVVTVEDGADSIWAKIVDKTLSKIEDNLFSTIIGENTFQNFSSLSYVSLPNAILCGEYAFRNCSALENVNLQNVSIVSSNAFYSCASLSQINIENTERIRASAFAKCGLNNIKLLSVSAIDASAFQECKNMSHAILGNMEKSLIAFGQTCFTTCYNLLSLYILTSNVCSWSQGMLNATPITGYTTSTGGTYGSVFVPESLYSKYIVKAGWSTYSDRIVGLTSSQVENVIENNTHIL